ncbi:hypothetical protein ABC383_22720 [Noviherbaspirillum sp. 1P10PC]|uniref:hypothetical protein n=1 Tax=Noviherbaspirillum sp. 1P10PC TaxID=3132292 RepID=UPI0039A07BDC
MGNSIQIKHIGLISETKNLSFSELSKTSAALQKQAMRDFGPIWNIYATVDAFASLEDVPIDYWPIIVRDDIKFSGAAGIHLDKDGAPFALVQYSPGWSLTASHECLEMLGDPTGDIVRAGQSPNPEQGRVNFLVEVCDPSEAAEFSYQVNGIVVSDFYTPNYFDPVAAPGVRYSYSGAIRKPREVLKGGYLSWHDPQTDHWYQETFFSGKKSEFRDLGLLSQKEGSIRTQIYRLTPEALKAQKVVPKSESVQKMMLSSAGLAGSAKMEALRRQIDNLLTLGEPSV